MTIIDRNLHSQLKAKDSNLILHKSWQTPSFMPQDIQHQISQAIIPMVDKLLLD